MNFIGFITGKVTAGLYVKIVPLRAEYGPVSYLGDSAQYSVGDRVLVTKVGLSDFAVLGVLHPPTLVKEKTP